MNDLVRAAIDLVRTDAEASGVPTPPFIDADWEWYDDDHAVDGPDFVATVANRVQEDIIEQLWPSRPTNWPVCPAHPRTHPMKPTVVDGAAVWACVDGTAYAPMARCTARGIKRGALANGAHSRSVSDLSRVPVLGVLGRCRPA